MIVNIYRNFSDLWEIFCEISGDSGWFFFFRKVTQIPWACVVVYVKHKTCIVHSRKNKNKSRQAGFGYANGKYGDYIWYRVQWSERSMGLSRIGLGMYIRKKKSIIYLQKKKNSM